MSNADSNGFDVVCVYAICAIRSTPPLHCRLDGRSSSYFHRSSSSASLSLHHLLLLLAHLHLHGSDYSIPVSSSSWYFSCDSASSLSRPPLINGERLPLLPEGDTLTGRPGGEGSACGSSTNCRSSRFAEVGAMRCSASAYFGSSPRARRSRSSGLCARLLAIT